MARLPRRTASYGWMTVHILRLTRNTAGWDFPRADTKAACLQSIRHISNAPGSGPTACRKAIRPRWWSILHGTETASLTDPVNLTEPYVRNTNQFRSGRQPEAWLYA